MAQLQILDLQVWEGDGVVKSARKLIGATNPLEADSGTIRGDFAIQTGRNVVHGSDSPENGIREASKQLCYLPHCMLSLNSTEYTVMQQKPSSAWKVAVFHITGNATVYCAAELWFGGDDDMVDWQPSLKPWLVE